MDSHGGAICAPKDVMAPDVITVDPETTVQALAMVFLIVEFHALDAGEAVSLRALFASFGVLRMHRPKPVKGTILPRNRGHLANVQ